MTLRCLNHQTHHIATWTHIKVTLARNTFHLTPNIQPQPHGMTSEQCTLIYKHTHKHTHTAPKWAVIMWQKENPSVGVSVFFSCFCRTDLTACWPFKCNINMFHNFCTDLVNFAWIFGEYFDFIGRKTALNRSKQNKERDSFEDQLKLLSDKFTVFINCRP